MQRHIPGMKGCTRVGLWLLFSTLVVGCGETKPLVKAAPKVYVPPAQPASVDTPSIENTQDRVQDIRKVCARKAATSPDLGRCWMAESERQSGKKFETEIRITMLIAVDGSVPEARVTNPVAGLGELETCVLEAVKSWPYPAGQIPAPVQCNFYLRSIM